MQITDFRAYNYKSLRRLEMTPQQFGLVVGANAGGKSNLADCIDFLSEIYRYGLELAIARKGGYENIAYRRQRRSKSAMGLYVQLEFTTAMRRHGERSKRQTLRLRALHSFAFRASGEAIRAPFRVAREYLRLELEEGGTWGLLIVLRRSGDSVKVSLTEDEELELPLRSASDEARREIIGTSALDFLDAADWQIEPTELMVTDLRGLLTPLRAMVTELGSIRVFQLHPNVSREFGVPTPGVELDRAGGNLPAVVDLLRRDYAGLWKNVVNTMRLLMPGLETIDVGYTGSRRLELLFREKGFGRPWTVNEVSDGTIQTLALLVAIHDPRSSALIIEEPENSVHPWIIRHIVNACVSASSQKQVLITTHSPVVVNHVRPDQVWVMWRHGGESRIASLAKLDDSVMGLWASGKVATFDVLDSGMVEVAIPPGPEVDVSGHEHQEE